MTIGAGLSGIQLAYHIQKECENVEHVIYEKNSDVGGTWYENRYPGKMYKIGSCTLGLTSSKVALVTSLPTHTLSTLL